MTKLQYSEKNVYTKHTFFGQQRITHISRVFLLFRTQKYGGKLNKQIFLHLNTRTRISIYVLSIYYVMVGVLNLYVWFISVFIL